MKSLKIPLIATVIYFSLFLMGCAKEEDPIDKGSANNVASCSDGIQNQDETGIDCGGVCPPCAASSSEFSFTKDGKVENINQFDANRNPFKSPTVIGLIAITNEGNKLTIIVEEPDILGWSNGTSFSSLTPPNKITYESNVNGNTVIYSTANGNNSEELSFLVLEYKMGGRVYGRFNGVLDDGNGNTITIGDGKFDSKFVN